MKHLCYDHGPACITAGAAGQFKRGESKPVDDALAKNLLARTDIKFREVNATSPAKKKEA
jgi:hypothetical protein